MCMSVSAYGPVFCGARCHVHVCVRTWACVLWCQVPSGKLKQELHGHFSLVYDLSWSRKDTHLVSASADGTVRLEVLILLLLLFYLQCCSFIISVCLEMGRGCSFGFLVFVISQLLVASHCLWLITDSDLS